ncbi:MAG: T9SS type A sorting domain-containing protein [Bacteroidales bacterium]|nr:T9SS type A sorting domain-containing protein [Bacteroidales bacterium]MCF8403382.1 T9SS type A sorting domain-containing protein [Bacteroidales bacterium]
MKKKTFTLILVILFSAYWISAQELRVEPNTNITVNTGSTLDLSSGDLVLESDATGDASLIDKGNLTYSGGGQANVQRYLTEAKWHLLSSPVNSLHAGMFLGDYLQYHNESSNDWSDITSETFNMSVMQGFDVWSVEASPSTEVFSGITNTGTLYKPFTQNGLGWNLLGNPYPSAIDWDAVSIPFELNEAFWLFDPSIGANGDYVYYINGGGLANTTSQFIPSGQGFFVRATFGSGILVFNNNVRSYSGQAYYKDFADDALLVLKVSGNSISSQTAIRFNSNATPQVDRSFDVFKIFTDSPDVPLLYTVSNNENLAINTLPAVEGNEIVPLYFRAGTSGEYIINASEIESFDSNTPVLLVDPESSAIHDLRQNSEYHFDYKSGNDKGFLVYFTNPENASLTGDIDIFASGPILTVNFPVLEFTNKSFSAQIWVFDMNGKAVLHTQTKSITNKIPLTVNSNIYLVKVISNGLLANKKVFIK